MAMILMVLAVASVTAGCPYQGTIGCDPLNDPAAVAEQQFQAKLAVENLKVQIDVRRGIVADLQAQLKTLTAELQTAKGDTTSVKERIASLEKRIAADQASIQGLRQSIAYIQPQKDKLQKELDDLITRLGGGEPAEPSGESG